jgi:hypothetical protein
MEKTQQYYIDEFYKFLESKEQGLSERFNGLYDKENYENVEDFLQDAEPFSFISDAFYWYEDDEIFWQQLDIEWCDLQQL